VKLLKVILPIMLLKFKQDRYATAFPVLIFSRNIDTLHNSSVTT